MLSKPFMNDLLKAMLILNLGILTMVPSCGHQEMTPVLKTADQYWEETGLGSTELESLLAETSCSSEEQSFLACVNSVSRMAEKYNLALSKAGNLRPMRTQDIANRVSEKKGLAQWQQLFEEKKNQISFLELWKDLDSNQVKPKERSAIIAAGINGFLSIYKDPHTYLMPVAMYDEVVANSETRNTNAGIVARRQGDQLIVRKVYPGSSAFKAGVRKGDRIAAMNGELVSHLLPSRVSEFLKMRSINKLGLQIVRKAEKLYLEILRSELNYPSVSAQLIEGPKRVGLITIHKFSKRVCRMTRKELISLKEQNIQGLLLDLRDNPGGQVEEAACVAGLFLDKGTLLFETRYLDHSRPSDQYYSEKEPLYKGSLAVLINSGSASASEIVAGVLRDQNRAKLIGERSFGKGTFQDGQIWGPNPKIALFATEGLYYFPSGWTPQLIGLQPDLAVNFNAADISREDELFFNPLVPLDSWVGPQSLSWLIEKDCDMSLSPFVSSSSFEGLNEDPQLQKAQAFLSCGEKNDRHGSL